MTAHVVLIHGGTSTGAKLQQILPSAKVTVIYEPGLSTAYDEVNGLAKKYPTITALMDHYSPGWVPLNDPLVVLAYSAGGWALRYYLRSAAAREIVTAAVFLDSLYASGGACAPFDGVLAYAKLAQANPNDHRLVMTYSQAHPGPGICSEYIANQAGGGSGPGVFVEATPNTDHGGQQGIVGPQVVEKYIAGWLPSGKPTTLLARLKPSNTTVLAALAALGGFGAYYAWQKRKHQR